MSSHSDLIRCVAGDISSVSLGHTQCHEHIWLEKGASYEVNPALCMDDYEKSLAELKAYRDAEGGTIVDAQPGGFGRNIHVLSRLSQESGVNIISVSGMHKLCFLDEPDRFADKTDKQLSDVFIRELTEGMESGDARVKTGMLKLALDVGGIEDRRYTGLYDGVLRAAGETGAPLMVHTEKGNDLSALLKRCREYDLASERLLICHLDRTNPDSDAHRHLLDAGCNLCYDSVHRYKYVSDAQELLLIRAMTEEGYSRQIVLSLDTTNQRLRNYGSADMGLDEILTDFIPKMVGYGISQTAIDAMCRKNAKRILQFNV